ncbi:MAG: PQQ-dependent sugar dehydrogenase, partial [Vicinamibacterales bacterium]
MAVPFHSRNPPLGPPIETSLAVPLLKGVGYLLLALYGSTASRRTRGLRWFELPLVAALLVAIAQFALRPPLTFTLTDLSISMGLALALAVVPYFTLPAWPAVSIGVAGVAVAAAAVLLPSPLAPNVEPHILSSLYYQLDAIVHTGLTSSTSSTAPRRGGAIERRGSAIILATGDGNFYRLDRDASGGLVSRPLPMQVRLEQEAIDATEGAPQGDRQPLSLTDITLDISTTPPTVYASWENWDVERACMTLRVGARELTEDSASAAPAADWRVLFDSWPCLPISANFDLPQSGGRLAWLGDELLVTVGHVGLPETPVPPSQDPSVAYGKIVAIDVYAEPGTGAGAQIFSSGHRSQQGLFADGDRVWSTEHGARGGDELNLITRGGNYGYPYVVWGTQYVGETLRKLQPHEEATFTQPVHAFVPSIAISNLIRVEGQLFTEWRGDLLIGSLAAQTLHRVRLIGDRVVYVEPIAVGYRIRDIIEDGDGRIMMWTDEGAVLELRPRRAVPVSN